MGCMSSKPAEQNMQGSQRRRLSVGHVEGGGASADDPKAEEADRGLIKELDEAKLLEILASSDGERKFSLGSETDKDLNKRQSFAAKTEVKDGVIADKDTHGIGFTCRKGLKPESPNQDSWFIIKLENIALYSVCDGHGQKGHDISQFVKDNLPKIILKDNRLHSKNFEDRKAMLIDSFKRCQSLIATQTRTGKLNATMSGTTVTCILHDLEEKKLYYAQAGDSGAVLLKEGKGTYLIADHKPECKDERKRIEAAGGRVVFDGYANHRVYAKNGRYPGLNMSRCLGDLLGHSDAGLSCEPEVVEVDVKEDNIQLILCSDGVWEFITAQEAAEMVGKFKRAQAPQAANTLAKEAWDRWIREEGGAVVDDITAVVIALSPPNRED